MADISSMGWLSAGAQFIGAMATIEGGKAARVTAERQKVQAQFHAWQAEREAGLTIALSQQRAKEERRQADMMASRALAVAAASGAGVTDPTIVKLLANTRGEGVYRSNVALYEGEARARELRLSGAAGMVAGADAVVEGANKQMGAAFAGIGQMGKAGLSLYEKFGAGGPPKVTNPLAGALDEYELFSGKGMTDPRYG